MDADKNRGPDNERGLSSAEYRARLLTKLNCLIAVLEVAIAKIARSIDLPGANEQRLVKIRGNLENTLAICNRAKMTLEKSLDRPRSSSTQRARTKGKMSYRDYVELSSIEEYRKFKDRSPITGGEIESVNIETLLRKLAES